MPNPLLFCNIGWMEKYRGISRTDKIVGGGKYVRDEGRGLEVCNFHAYRRKVFGYVQPVGDQIKLERLGATSDDAAVQNVDVVVTARRPGGGTVIVGWFLNATVYRAFQNLVDASTLHRDNEISGYRYSASEADVTLLPVDRRTFEIPRGKGGMGQSNVWYADEVDQRWLDRVRAFLNGGTRQPATSRRDRTKPDQARKVVVEKQAVETVWEYFESLGYEIGSVEKDNVGWDLEAYCESSQLCIEVKGLSGKAVSVELTSNEYKAFLRNDPNYRLCVVTCCLDQPKLHVFRFNIPSESWIDDLNDSDSMLAVQERVSASITLAL
jgi:hypothetical protein